MGNQEVYLEVHDVSHRFSSTHTLFEHVNFTAEPGQMTALCGPSGSGKSTLLSIIAGWEIPLTGRIELCNISTVGWVFQNPYGVARRSVLDHVVFPLLAQGKTRKDAQAQAYDVLQRFSLEEVAERQFSDLSGGEAQRLMLARAVCVHPDLLLVDEPTAQLDMSTAHSVNSVLRELSGQGMVVIIATHDADTRNACDCVINLADFLPHEDEDE
ncbi:ATP-binding cassette domain-containing protein [Alloscardovia venturai]|uniref:ATP-binding cassette domain-containing protein n=1 Tax=Alloscardovia venturai TaxID=1769421 RepID=A0ABW2YB59_9BIFI